MFSLARMPRIRSVVDMGASVDRVNAFAGPGAQASRPRRRASARRRRAGAFIRSRRASHRSNREKVNKLCACFDAIRRTEAKLAASPAPGGDRAPRSDGPSRGLRKRFDMLALRKASRRCAGRPEGGGGVAAITQAASGAGEVRRSSRRGVASRAVPRETPSSDCRDERRGRTPNAAARHARRRQALRRRAGAARRRLRPQARRDPCAARRERRRQINADERPLRRVRARRRRDAARGRSPSASTIRAPRRRPASPRSSRSSTSCRASTSPPICSSGASSRAAGVLDRAAMRKEAIKRLERRRQGHRRRPAGRRAFGRAPADRRHRQGADLRSNILIMDEPTAALTASEVERLFAVMREIAARGVGIVYISHRLEEVPRVADRVTVMRDGQVAGVQPANAPQSELVRLLVGRPLDELYPKRAASVRQAGPPLDHARFTPQTERPGWQAPEDMSARGARRRDRRPRRHHGRRPHRAVDRALRRGRRRQMVRAWSRSTARPRA